MVFAVNGLSGARLTRRITEAELRLPLAPSGVRSRDRIGNTTSFVLPEGIIQKFQDGVTQLIGASHIRF